MRLRNFAILAAIGLAGCGGCSAITQTASVVSSNQAVLGATSVDEKALLDLEAAYYGASVLIEAGIEQGFINGANATQVSEAYRLGTNALVAARKAYVAGDAKAFSDKVAAARALVAEVWSLLPNKPAA